jgi:predicted DCC family thiol-disulfide oxidoreductase YuxK
MYKDLQNPSARPVILIDGMCYLCSGLARFIINNDAYKKFRLGTLQSKTGQDLLKKYGLKKEDIDSIVLIEEPYLYLKAKAVFRIAYHLGGFWKAILIFKLLPGRINDYLYDLMAKYRYKVFGKRNDCLIIK